MRARTSITIWLWTLVLLSALPLMGFFVYSAYGYAQERQSALENSLIDQTEDLVQEAQARLDLAAGELSSLAQSNAAVANDISGLYAFAQRVQQSSSTLAAISLVDRNDRLVFLTLRPLGTPLPASQLDSVHEAMRTRKPNLSKPFQSPISTRQVVALNMPVVINGEVVYCLRGIFGVDMLSGLIQRDSLHTDWIAGIFDQDGITVARSRSPEKYVGQQAAPALIDAMRNKTRTVWGGVSKEGIDILSASRPIGPWQWTVAVAVPTQTLAAPLHRELTHFALLALGTLVVLALTVAALNRHITQGLSSVVDDARTALSGKLRPGSSTGILELDQLRDSLMQADIYRHAIVEQVEVRTAELKAAQQQLTEFAQQQEDQVENERLRIAREVHDQIGAIFTGVSMLINGLPRESLNDSERRVLDEALRQGLTTARRITAELRPPLLDDLGLESALQELARSVLAPAQVTSRVALTDTDWLTARQTIGLYRITQEAVTNVLRHAQASRCDIDGHVNDDGRYELLIVDNGDGMTSPETVNGHFGLTGMRERARLMGGELHIDSHPGGGTAVRVTIPLTAEVRPDDRSLPDR